MNATDYYSKAWGELSKNLVSWVIFYLVFMVVAGFTCGLGIVLMPNVMREVRDCVATGRGPEIGALFKFDRISNDAVNAILFYAAIFVGSWVIIGSLVAAVLLQLLFPLAADDRYAPMDNAKLSVKHVLAHLGDHIVFFLIGAAIVTISSLLCYVPVLVAAPLVGIAQWLWYQDLRAELDQIASAEGVRMING